MTPGQRTRRQRDEVIAAARKQGVTYRQLARVFGLPCSRIVNIVKNLEAEHARQQAHRAQRDPTYRESFREHADGRKRERSSRPGQ